MPTPSQPSVLPEPYDAQWNGDLALWAGTDGHTGSGRVVHPVRLAADKLLQAALDNVLDQLPAAQVLARIRTAQATAGDTRGNFAWYYEDGKVTDTNSAFFVILPLLMLDFEFGAALAPTERETVRTMLRESMHWFRRECLPTHRARRYPNKCLGDFACLWLAGEALDALPPELETSFSDTLAYLRDSPWGWGEHLSDVYGKVCQDELALLLAYGRRLSTTNRALVTELFVDLDRLDALFADGPRVPAIRNYDSTVPPLADPQHTGNYRPWRKFLRPWAEDVSRAHPAAAVAWQHGVGDLLPPWRPGRGAVRVQCSGGAQALAWVADNWRLGAMSTYPLECDVNFVSHGLHWQSMPVAWWHQAGDWGYLQWRATDRERTHALPVLSRYDKTSHILTTTEHPAGVGCTCGTQQVREFAVLRTLPGLGPGWQRVADRFRMIAGSGRQPRFAASSNWHCVHLDYGTEVLTVAVIALDVAPGLTVRLETEPDLGWALTAEYDLTVGAGPIAPRFLWYLTVADRPAPPPTCTVADTKVVVSLAAANITLE